MEIYSLKKYVGISRRKIARFANGLKGKKVSLVKAQLLTLPQKAAKELYKAIVSAEYNFQFGNPNFNTDSLIIKNIQVDVGPTMKRMRPRARGSADTIRKRSCHIKVMVSD